MNARIFACVWAYFGLVLTVQTRMTLKPSISADEYISGETIELSCNTTVYRRPSTLWQYSKDFNSTRQNIVRGVTVDDSFKDRFTTDLSVTNVSTLIIRTAQCSDSGVYFCLDDALGRNTTEEELFVVISVRPDVSTSSADAQQQYKELNTYICVSLIALGSVLFFLLCCLGLTKRRSGRNSVRSFISSKALIEPIYTSQKLKTASSGNRLLITGTSHLSIITEEETWQHCRLTG